MAKVNEFEYKATKVIGQIGNEEDKSYSTVELGHFVADGKEYGDKIYIISHFKNRNGSDGSRVTAKFTVDEFNALKEMEVDE